MTKWWLDALKEPPKGGKKGEFVANNGWMYRLLHDDDKDQTREKSEDRYPLNTFQELYLFIIAVATVLNFLVNLASNIVQMVAGFEEIFTR